MKSIGSVLHVLLFVQLLMSQENLWAEGIKSDSSILEVSIVELIARPEEFVGKSVRVIGVYLHDADNERLYSSRETMALYNYPSSLLLTSRRNGRLIDYQWTRKWVEIIGVFDFDPETRVKSLKDIKSAMLLERGRTVGGQE